MLVTSFLFPWLLWIFNKLIILRKYRTVRRSSGTTVLSVTREWSCAAASRVRRRGESALFQDVFDSFKSSPSEGMNVHRKLGTIQPTVEIRFLFTDLVLQSYKILQTG